MASPISAGEVLQIAQFAWTLYNSCKAAKGQFVQIGKEVSATRAVIRLVHVDCKNPQSILNQVDDKQKSIRKQLRVYVDNCNQSLKEVEALLKRYNGMSSLDRVAWAWWGREEVEGIKSDLSSFATQLDQFVDALTLKGMGFVNQRVRSLQKGLGRIENALEAHHGDEKAAISEIMHDVRQSGSSSENTQKYEEVITGYAKEVSQSDEIEQVPSPRPRTPDPTRGRANSAASTLTVPKTQRRSKSADGVIDKKGGRKAKPPVKGKGKENKPKHTLECWLIQIKTTDTWLVTLQKSEKEKQVRGQCKLQQMAEQFKSSPARLKLAKDHDLVKWVVDDRKKDEKDTKYTWKPHAAKIERKGTVYLGMGIEEQAMVILKRQLTAEAQKKADKKEKERGQLKAKADEKKEKAALGAKVAAMGEEKATLGKEKRALAKEIAALEKKKEKLLNIPTIRTPGQDDNAKSVQELDKKDQDCKYFPNCTNQSCPYRHPKMPMCRFGSDCTDKNCKYTHKECRFSPCTKSDCEYRHSKGQRRSSSIASRGSNKSSKSGA